MHNLRHRLWIAISVSTLAIVSSYPAIAKPQPRFKVIAISQVSNKTAVMDSISPQPVDAILANARIISSSQATRTPAYSRSVTRIVNVHISADRVSQGVLNFTNHRVNSRSNNSGAIDRWID